MSALLIAKVAAACDRFALTRRGRIWFLIIRRFRAATRLGQMRLVWSAVVDSLGYMRDTGRALSPRHRFSEVLSAPDLGVRFHVRAGTDDVANALPFRERDVHHAVLAPLREGDVFVDVGANIGYYTVLAAQKVGQTGTVAAIEPVPGTIAQLRENIRLNGLSNVEVIQTAVCDGGTRELLLTIPNGAFGMASAVHGGGRGDTAGVAATTLDEICSRFDHISSLKIDVEGSEYSVLRGAESTLRKTKQVVVECNEHRAEIEALLTAAEFEVEKLEYSTYILARQAEPIPENGSRRGASAY